MNYQSYPSAPDVQQFITNSGLTPVELSQQDVEELLQMLVFDGQLERIIQGDKWVYHPTKSPLQSDDFRMDQWTELPCGK